jgi:nicotinamidase-related amidase
MLEMVSYTEPHWQNSALITIDVHCCTLAGGQLEVPGTDEALARIIELARAFRETGRPIVHVARLYLPDGSNVDLCRRADVEAGATFLTPDADDTELAPGLLPGGAQLDSEALLDGRVQVVGPAEVVIYKPRWGAFFQTPLETHLASLDVDTLVFAGANFPNCPRTSIYEASERDLRVVAVMDAISGIYERGERELEGIGVTLLSTADVLRAVGELAPRTSAMSEQP